MKNAETLTPKYWISKDNTQYLISPEKPNEQVEWREVSQNEFQEEFLQAWRNITEE